MACSSTTAVYTATWCSNGSWAASNQSTSASSTFYVHLVDDHLRDPARDDPTLGSSSSPGRNDVTVEVALLGVSTPLAVTEWRRLTTKASPPPKTSSPPWPASSGNIESTTTTAP